MSFKRWGRCSVHCIKTSFAYQLHSAASDAIIFNFQHWLVYIDTFCQFHGTLERWCIEKYYDQTIDELRQSQTLQNGSITITCSSYLDHSIFETTKKLHDPYSLEEIFQFILAIENNEYSVFFDSILKRRVWDRIQKQMEPICYAIHFIDRSSSWF